MDPQVLDLLRLYSLRTVELTFTSFNQQLCIHSHSEVITMLPFSQVPRSVYLMLPSWELQGGDQSPLLPTGVGPHWGLAPGPYLILWPFLVSWSVPPMSPVGAAVQRVRTPVQKRACNTVKQCSSSFISGLLHSNPAEPSVQFLKGLALLESRWGLQKCCRNQYLRNQTPHLESWRTQVYYTGGPRGVNTPSSEHQKKGLQSFLYMDRND